MDTFSTPRGLLHPERHGLEVWGHRATATSGSGFAEADWLGVQPVELAKPSQRLSGTTRNEALASASGAPRIDQAATVAEPE